MIYWSNVRSIRWLTEWFGQHPYDWEYSRISRMTHFSSIPFRSSQNLSHFARLLLLLVPRRTIPGIVSLVPARRSTPFRIRPLYPTNHHVTGKGRRRAGVIPARAVNLQTANLERVIRRPLLFLSVRHWRWVCLLASPRPRSSSEVSGVSQNFSAELDAVYRLYCREYELQLQLQQQQLELQRQQLQLQHQLQQMELMQQQQLTRTLPLATQPQVRVPGGCSG